MPFGINRGDNRGSLRNLHDREPTDSLSNYDSTEVTEECEDYGRNCPWWYKKKDGGSKIIPKSLLPDSGKRRSKSRNKPKKSVKRVKTAKRSKSRKIRRRHK